MLTENKSSFAGQTDAELIAQAELASKSNIVDPEIAARQLLVDLESRLVGRSKTLEEKYWAVRGEIESHVRQAIAEDRLKTEPVSPEFLLLQQRATELMQKFEQLLTRIHDAPPRSNRRRVLLENSEQQLKDLHDLELQMTSTVRPLEESIVSMQQRITALEPIWLGIQGAERLSYKLVTGLLLAEWSASGIRVLFLTVALAISVLVDRYTPATESVLAFIELPARHDIAISALFFAQAVLLEPLVTRMKRALAWKIFRRMVITSRQVHDKLIQLEENVSNAETFLANARRSAP